jgi:hypothetical protein
MVVPGICVLKFLKVEVVLLKHLRAPPKNTLVRLEQVPDRITVFVLLRLSGLGPLKHGVVPLNLKVSLLQALRVLVALNNLLIFGLLQFAQT